MCLALKGENEDTQGTCVLHVYYLHAYSGCMYKDIWIRGDLRTSKAELFYRKAKS